VLLIRCAAPLGVICNVPAHFLVLVTGKHLAMILACLRACCRGVAVGLTGNGSTNAVVKRAARTILAAARQHAVEAATAAAIECDSDEVAGGLQVSWRCCVHVAHMARSSLAEAAKAVCLPCLMSQWLTDGPV